MKGSVSCDRRTLEVLTNEEIFEQSHEGSVGVSEPCGD